MPRPSQRTRSRKRVTKPLPGGRKGTHFKSEPGASPKCSRCGKRLAGISNRSSLKLRKLNQSRKTVGRIYGGQLCHSCLQLSLRELARTA